MIYKHPTSTKKAHGQVCIPTKLLALSDYLYFIYLFSCLFYLFIIYLQLTKKLAQAIESHYSHSLKFIGLASKTVNYKISLTDIYVTALLQPGSVLMSEALSPSKAM